MNDIKRSFRSLFRKGEANAVKILCLGIGLALGLLLLAEVIYQRSYDSFIPRLEDTYILSENIRGKDEPWKSYFSTSGGVAPGVKDVCAEVEAATRFTPVTNAQSGIFVTEDRRELAGSVCMTDTSFFDVFPLKIVTGEDPKTGLDKAGTVYISEKLYRAAGADILGRTVKYKFNEKLELTVAGVFETLPENTTLQDMDMLVGMPSVNLFFGYDGTQEWFGNDRYRGYVRLRHGTDPTTLQARMDKMIRDHVGESLDRMGMKYTISLTPMKNLLLDDDGAHTLNFVFLGFGIIMLLVSVLNYILLVLSGMVNRSKSIATYRCYGAGKGDICRMVLAESFVHVCCLSLPLAALIVFAMQDVVQQYLEHSLRSLFPAQTVAVCAAIVLLITAVCGLLPAYIYTKIPVTYAYRRYTESKRQWKLALLFVQFVLTSLFVGLITVIGLQYDKLTHYDLGYDYRNTLVMSYRGVSQREVDLCLERLRADPNVAGATVADQYLTDEMSGDNVFNGETREVYMNIGDLYGVGEDFFGTLDIPVTEGRTFTVGMADSLNREVMVSESFVEKMRERAGWTGSPIGQEIYVTSYERRNPLTIVGVYRDFQVGSLHGNRDLRPTLAVSGLYVDGNNIYVRLHNMGSDNIARVQDIVNSTMTSNPPTVYMMSLQVGNLYEQLRNIRNSVVFAGLCILLISLGGLVAYVRDEVARRRYEIAVRSILGAGMWSVQRLFQRHLLPVAVPGTAIGCLLAWRVGDAILEMFAVKVRLTWWLFTLCAVAVLALVMAVSMLLVHRTAHANPAENLRSE